MRALRTCLAVCVLNTENSLKVELKFELFHFCTSGFVFYQQISDLKVIFGCPFDEGNTHTPDVAYGCEIWPPMLTDEQRLRVFENGVMI